MIKCCIQQTVASFISNLVNQVVEQLSKVEGLSKILVAEHEAYKGFLPGNQENHKLYIYITFYFLGRVKF